MKNEIYDLVIIGGGIMGLLTAYYASTLNKRVLLIEKRTIGNPQSSSFGITRSIRNDYLDIDYLRLSYESRGLWKELERTFGRKFVIDCGVLNIASRSISSDINASYATQSLRSLTSSGLPVLSFSQRELTRRYPQFQATIGVLDVEAGLLLLPKILSSILTALNQNGVELLEKTLIRNIAKKMSSYDISLPKSTIVTKSVVITAGVWINEVLGLWKGIPIKPLPITAVTPPKTVYVVPTKNRTLYTVARMPVFAYLDVGIFGHPLIESETPGVKIGYFETPGFSSGSQKIRNVQDFLNYCIPSLAGAMIKEPKQQELGSFEMTPDGNFIIGALPGLSNVFVAGGFCGTGYKFAPIVGKALAQLSCQGGTVYDLRKFDPARL